MRTRTFAATLLTAAAVVAAVWLPAASGRAASNRLAAYVVPTNRGPVPACGQTCTPTNGVNEFIYVANGNSATALTQMPFGTNRDTVPNAFVVSSIDTNIYVNGVDTYDSIDTPPPGSTTGPFFPSFSGHWPATVTCPTSGPPCTVVGNPAILPGEITTILYSGWAHGATEANGTYVFRYTIHGTFNGVPTDLSAVSPPIVMTS